MPTNNFKPFGIGSGANVTDQTAYEALAALLTGFQSGKASSAQINKALRQGTVMSSVLAQFICDTLAVDVLDNGDTATLLTNFIAAMKQNANGRLLDFKIFASSGTWTPSEGTKKIRVVAIGSGGAGGSAGTNTSTTLSSGSGGGSGSFADAWFSTFPSSIAVALGSAGVANISGSGGDGGVTTFGSLISCPGGKGGGVVQASTSNIMNYSAQGGGGLLPTVTGADEYFSAVGQSGTNGFVYGTAGIALAGFAAASVIGGAPPQLSPGSVGVAATTAGAGGQGSSTNVSTSAKLAGNGGPAIIMVWEYA